MPYCDIDRGRSRLGECRRFRHLVRNVYATNLDPHRIDPLVTGLSGLWQGVRSAFIDFADVLDTSATPPE